MTVITGQQSRIEYNKIVEEKSHLTTFRIGVISPEPQGKPTEFFAESGVDLIVFFGEFPDFFSFSRHNSLVQHFPQDFGQKSQIVIASNETLSPEYQSVTKHNISSFFPALTEFVKGNFEFVAKKRERKLSSMWRKISTEDP